MKLNSEQVKRALSQFEAQAIPDNHPAIPQLNDLFGEHTYFLNSSGLNVLEAAETPESKGEAGKVVSLAHWSNEDQTSLTPHDPESTGIVVALGLKH